MSNPKNQNQKDPAEVRKSIRDCWSRAASGWDTRRDLLRSLTMPVSVWMIDAISPQPGQTILELAAGIGDTGFLASELVQPGGELITSDSSPEMLTKAQRRADELGIKNASFRLLNAESIELPTASVDLILCRWGYMLLVDPATALRETRRVLKGGGGVALAAWADRASNPWSSISTDILIERGMMLANVSGGQPGPFTWGEPGVIDEFLSDAGFEDISVQTVDFTMKYRSFQDWWETLLDMGRSFADAIEPLDETVIQEIKVELDTRSKSFLSTEGELEFPAKTWVAKAKSPG